MRDRDDSTSTHRARGDAYARGMGRSARDGSSARVRERANGGRRDDAREASIARARGVKIHARVRRGVFARARGWARGGGRDATTDAIARAEGRVGRANE